LASLRALVPDPALARVPAVATILPRPLFPAGVASGTEMTSAARPAAPAGWDIHYAQLGPGRCRRRWTAVRTGGLQAWCEEWSLAVLERGRAPRGAVTFVVPVGARGDARVQGRPQPPGAVAVLFDGDELDYRSAGPACLITLSVERATLDGHLRALLGRPLGELRLQGHLAGLRADERALVRLCQRLAARAADDPRLLRDPPRAAAEERALVAALVAGSHRSEARDLGSRRGRGLARRAEAWLRENLAEPPTIATLCGAVNASERTLHEAFREHLGTTPKAYVKALRLNAARRDLLRGGARTRVTDVALDWGFLHFGWFSQDYRRLFGETPSQTLHRGRADAGGGRSHGADARAGTGGSGPLAGAYAM
jgi:AraC family ethanolamine operon transcriptional activator